MIGSCDPATRGQATNAKTLQSGLALVDIIWSWDGVSVQPNCDGPLITVHGVNGDTVSHWLHFKGRRGQPKSIELPPGTNVTRNQAWLAQRGFDSVMDTVDVQLTDSADTPL